MLQLLFDGFQRFCHIYFIQFKIHSEVNDQCESNRHKDCDQITCRLDVNIEAQQVDLDLAHDEAMKGFSCRNTHQCRDNRKHKIFTEYISVGFRWIEAKNFDGCDFSDSFCNIDIRQIIKNDECQRAQHMP